MLGERAVLRHTLSPATARSPNVSSSAAPNASSRGSAPSYPKKGPPRASSGASTARRARYCLLMLIVVCACAFVWRTVRLTREMSEHGLFTVDEGTTQLDRVERAFRGNDADAQAVMEHLIGMPFNASTFNIHTTASTSLTVIIPLRGQLFPLGHLTAQGLCRSLPRRGAGASLADTLFTEVEVVFPVTSRLRLDDVRRTLPSEAWTPLRVQPSLHDLPKMSVIGGLTLTDMTSVAGVPVAPCIHRIVVVVIASKANGLETFVDPVDKMMGRDGAPSVTAADVGARETNNAGLERMTRTFNETIPRSVVPLSQLVLGALHVSDVQSSHFVLMSEAYFPAASLGAGGLGRASFLGNLLEPFVAHVRRVTAAGGGVGDVSEEAIPVAAQCTALQPQHWASNDPTHLYAAGDITQEGRETAIPHTVAQQNMPDQAAASSGKKPRKKRQASRAPVQPSPFELQDGAHVRFQWDRLPFVQSDARDLVVVDKGAESGTGVDRQYATPYVVRRMHGFLATDKRTHTPEDVVDMVSPYCTAFDRTKFLLLGGLSNDGSAVFTNRIYAGMFSQEIRQRVLTLVKVRITLVERIMEGISLVDVHKAGNVLRQQVRLAYSEVVESTNLWEDVTGKKYDRTMRTDTFTTSAMASEVAAQQAFADGGGASKVEERLAWQSARLHEAARELLKLGKNKDSSATEEETGWDLSLRLQRFDRLWRVLATNATAVLLREWFPSTLMGYYASNNMQVVHPSYMADGRFQDAWGKALFAMHRSRGGIPHAHAGEMRLREEALRKRPITVFWSSFCCGCCGFSSEIVHFVYPLSRRRRVHIFNDDLCFCKGYPAAIHDALKRLFMLQEHYLIQYRDPKEISVWISHTDPNSYVQVVTERRKPSYFVGRSMYEFSKIPDLWVKNIDKHCDEVWVPCTFVKNVFLSSGVNPNKIVVIPEALDTYFFDPSAQLPIPLPLTHSRPTWRVWENRVLDRSAAYQEHYRFYTNFKWEPRKGWDTLLRAYYNAFAANRSADGGFPKVSLYIQTVYFLNAAVPKGFDVRNVTHILHAIESWIAKSFPPGVTLQDSFPHIVIVTEHITEVELVSVYRTMDAFVLPTRGEGWGLPTIQALSMGMPTISTNWGGNTEFMRRDTSFLIPVDGLEELPQDSMYFYEAAKKWAIPSLAATTQYMLWCAEHPEAAKAVGLRAREDVHRRFSEEAIADIVDARLDAIRNIVIAREGSR